MSRGHHLQEERLFDCYMAVRNGESPDPPVAEHLTDCDECNERYAQLSRFMDALDAEAIAEADAIFTPERLRLQQQAIVRRLEHLGHPARVISFPGRTSGRHIGTAAPRTARRWIAASLAAGLFVGVGTGLFLDWQASWAIAGRRASRAARQTVLTAPSNVLEIALPDTSEADDAFLTEIEIAGQRPRIRELLAVDALTPHAREVTLR
jgi:anti-sigma factor RsiW